MLRVWLQLVCSHDIGLRGPWHSSLLMCHYTRFCGRLSWHHVRLKAMLNFDSAFIKAVYQPSRLPDQMECCTAQKYLAARPGTHDAQSNPLCQVWTSQLNNEGC